jgi:RNA polymerase sigma factor (sigma-70 family)
MFATDAPDWMRITRALARRACLGFPSIDADEVLSAAALAVWWAARKYDPNRGAKLTTWLYTGGRLKLRQELITIAERRRRLPVISFEAMAGDGDQPFDPPARPERHGIGEYIEHLSPADQELLRLRFEGGLTHEEIGRAYGVSKARIGKKMQRAIRKVAWEGRCAGWRG